MSDLRIFEVAETLPDYALLYARSDELGKDVVVIGRGTQRGQSIFLGGSLRGWAWGATDMVPRWGENQISLADGSSLYATFDQGGKANECQLSSGDSGGAVFIKDGGAWKLAGINFSVRSSVSTTASSPEFTAALFDTRGFYDLSHDLISESAPVPTGFHAVRMSARMPWIQSIIAPALVNISSRAKVGGGDKVAIAGFIVTGDPTRDKRVLLRGIGPSLSANGVTGALADPSLELHDSDGRLLASNNDWQSSQAAAIQTTGLAPSDLKDAAILAVIRPGSYTAVLRGINDRSGIALVEVYDLEPTAGPRLANLSGRAFVGLGDDVLIGGVIFHSASDSLLLRALGPSLATHGVTDALSDPLIEVYDADGTLLGRNDNWVENGNASAIIKSELAPNDNRESAILLTPGVGSYTVVVRGAGETTGIGLVEAFILAR